MALLFVFVGCAEIFPDNCGFDGDITTTLNDLKMIVPQDLTVSAPDNITFSMQVSVFAIEYPPKYNS